MWQYIITGVILLAAFVFVAYRVMKTVRGKDTFACAFCNKQNCPAKQEEEDRQMAGSDPSARASLPGDNEDAAEGAGTSEEDVSTRSG